MFRSLVLALVQRVVAIRTISLLSMNAKVFADNISHKVDAELLKSMERNG